ncbi:MAG: hypothetical protein KAG18_03410 [Sinobacterium sp.]|nr:hypothetical protein [Sinobacterium sp.]
MIELIPIDTTSINVIKTELTVSIATASRHFEAYIADRSALEQLTESKTALLDVAGVLKLMPIAGAEVMISEMLLLLGALIEKKTAILDVELSALSHSFVGLPCYIEYAIDKEAAMPILVLPFINGLKSVQSQAITFESVFVSYDSVGDFEWPNITAADAVDDLPGFIKRHRQMYQIGLIGLIREENLNPKVQLMHRAVSRLASSLNNKEAVTVLRLAEAMLESMLDGTLNPSYTRKRVLSLVDRMLRQLVTDNTAAITTDAGLITELVYLNHIGLSTKPQSSVLTNALNLQPLSTCDADIQKERELMQGPNAETIMTMVAALRDELAQTKEVLEIAAQGVSQASDFNNTVSLFQRSSDILKVVGLTAPGQMLAEMKQKVATWAEGEKYTKDELLDIADGLIYVESVMSNLNRMDLNFDATLQDDEAKRKLMAQSQLSEAHLLVLQESQSAIAVAKKDISSFVESDFDVSNIAHINETLTSIRGGLSILNLTEANTVLEACSKFIQHIIDNGVDRDKADAVLETLADTLIALEYYLSEIELHDVAPPNILKVAEQSLASLGFSV